MAYDAPGWTRMKTEFWVTSFAAPGRAGHIAKRFEDAGWDGLLFTGSQRRGYRGGDPVRAGRV